MTEIKIKPWMMKQKSLSSQVLAGEIIKDTPGAILFENASIREWIPKSQVEYIKELDCKTEPPQAKPKEHIPRQPKKPLEVISEGDVYIIRFEYDKEIIEHLKSIGAKWNKKKRVWTLARTPIATESLDAVLRVLVRKFEVSTDNGFFEMIDELGHLKDAQSLKTKSLAELTQPEIRKHNAWEHQLQAYHFANELRSTLFYMGMGTGKTKVTIDLIMNRGHKRVLIVCPKSVMSVWAEEFEKHVDDPNAYMLYNGKKGNIKKRSFEAYRMLSIASTKKVPGIVVVNYEAVWREHYLSLAMGSDFDLVVCDESHKIKAHDSKVSKAMHKIGKRVDYKLCLTGTPMPNNPLDIFGQFRFLDDSVFGAYWTKFKNRYAQMGGYGGYQILGYQNQDELFEKISRLTYKASRDVLDLPDAVHIKRFVELGKETARAYKQMEKDFYVKLDAGEVTASNALSRLLRLQQITSGYLPDEDGKLMHIGSDKLSEFKDVLESIEQDEPVVVFCRFTQDVQNIKRACQEAGRTCAELSGQENTLKEWQGGEYDCIAIQIQAGGLGVDTTRARYCVYYSLGYSLGDYEQSLARIHRPGQDREVVYIHIIAEGTIDAKIYKALDNKKDIISAIIDRDV